MVKTPPELLKSPRMFLHPSQNVGRPESTRASHVHCQIVIARTKAFGRICRDSQVFSPYGYCLGHIVRMAHGISAHMKGKWK